MERIVDLFSGAGGMTLGFLNAGFEVLGAFDNWDPAVRTYGLNFNHPVFKADLSDEAKSISDIRDLNPSMIIGGPPCQDFSSAGNRNETGERANLTLSFARMVACVQPKIFVMENVSTIGKTKVFKRAVEVLEEAGYGLSHRVLNAALCGVPQRRKRFIMIGLLGGAKGCVPKVF